MYDLKPLFTLSSCSPYSSYVETLYSGVFYFSYLKTTYQWHMLGDTLLEVRLLYLTKTFLGFRVQINVLWFGKYNTAFIFHYAVFSTNREKTKEQKQNFFLLLLSKRISICVVIFYEKSFIFAAHTCELYLEKILFSCTNWSQFFFLFIDIKSCIRYF